MVIIEELLSFWRDEHRRAGYEEIRTPLILNRALWEQSGQRGAVQSLAHGQAVAQRDPPPHQGKDQRRHGHETEGAGKNQEHHHGLTEKRIEASRVYNRQTGDTDSGGGGKKSVDISMPPA